MTGGAGRITGGMNVICQSGVFGQHCEFNKNDCVQGSCQNAVKCVDGYDDYTCEDCKPGYTGDKCKLEDKCELDCKNGGTPINDGGSCRCDCKGRLFSMCVGLEVGCLVGEILLVFLRLRILLVMVFLFISLCGEVV